jgi:hypothetical protein
VEGSSAALQYQDDLEPAGPTASIPQFPAEFYWIRVAQEGSRLKAKAWLADGGTAEPVDWLEWDRPGRSGAVGIGAGSLDFQTAFDVDYFLVKASSLPSIHVHPAIYCEEGETSADCGRISITRIGSDVILTWDSTCSLYSTTALNLPFTRRAETSGARIPALGTQFFRLQP